MTCYQGNHRQWGMMCIVHYLKNVVQLCICQYADVSHVEEVLVGWTPLFANDFFVVDLIKFDENMTKMPFTTWPSSCNDLSSLALASSVLTEKTVKILKK